MTATQPAAATTGSGKTDGALVAAAHLVATTGDTLGTEQDDVALDDVMVLGVRLADLQLADLHEGSPAWNACRSYQVGQTQPWAAGHYETVARQWAHCANALTTLEQERGRDQ